MVEATSKTYYNIAPNCDRRLMMIQFTSAGYGVTVTLSAANSDTAAFSVVEAVFGMSTAGEPLAYSITGTSNVITVLNSGTKTFKALVVGY